MYAHELKQILISNIKTEKIFQKVCSVNELTTDLKEGLYVVNTAIPPKLLGHWTSVYISPKFLKPVYFDPYGFKPTENIKNYTKMNFDYSHRQLQSFVSTVPASN